MSTRVMVVMVSPRDVLSTDACAKLIWTSPRVAILERICEIREIHTDMPEFDSGQIIQTH